jgi:hypothetical protein
MFPCTKCGCCCKRVGKILSENKKYINYSNRNFIFPYNVDKNGACEMLNSDNTCKVYNNRPLICNIDAVVKEFGFDKDHYYKLSIEACNKMMDEDNIPKEFRIKSQNNIKKTFAFLTYD